MERCFYCPGTIAGNSNFPPLIARPGTLRAGMDAALGKACFILQSQQSRLAARCYEYGTGPELIPVAAFNIKYFVG